MRGRQDSPLRVQCRERQRALAVEAQSVPSRREGQPLFPIKEAQRSMHCSRSQPSHPTPAPQLTRLVTYDSR